VCDTLCVLGDGEALFAKNSDRPLAEPQVVEVVPRRPGGGRVRAQYLELDDPGAAAVVLSRPTWLWGAEHGVNEHGVAIGNEMVNTVDDPGAVPPALIGMDLVRLGLERGADAEGALDVMTTLLERHGQGGVADEVNKIAYWSSFLVADPRSAWVLETSGRRWAARPVQGGAAISNRLTMGRDWTRAGPGVAPGTDLELWLDPATPTGFADGRLAAGRAFVEGRPPEGPGRCDPGAAVAHLRDHGRGPWGAPGRDGRPCPPPAGVEPDGTGVTVCMHVRDFEATTASMVAELVEAGEGPGRAWVALGSPCASVFVPVLLPGVGQPGAVAPALGSDSLWRRFAALGRAVESDPAALGALRSVLGPLEASLWDEAEALGTDVGRWRRFAHGVDARLTSALDGLAAALASPA